MEIRHEQPNGGYHSEFVTAEQYQQKMDSGYSLRTYAAPDFKTEICRRFRVGSMIPTVREQFIDDVIAIAQNLGADL